MIYTAHKMHTYACTHTAKNLFEFTWKWTVEFDLFTAGGVSVAVAAAAVDIIIILV